LPKKPLIITIALGVTQVLSSTSWFRFSRFSLI
jgi:hypothetical protein